MVYEMKIASWREGRDERRIAYDNNNIEKDARMMETTCIMS